MPGINFEDEKTRLFYALEPMVPADAISAVGAVAKDINRILSEHLITRILALAGNLFPGSTRLQNRKAFEIDGAAFDVMYSLNDVRQPDVLVILIFQHLKVNDKPDAPPPEIEVPLPANGQYRAVHFCIEKNLKFDSNALAGLTEAIMAAGQLWLALKITRSIRAETARISTTLYDYLRVMLVGKGELLDGFIYGCLFEDRDFAILDEEATAGALRLASSRASRYRRTAGGMVLQLVSEIINIKDTAIAEACESSEPYIRVPLDETRKYYRHSEDLADSMAAVWEESATCFPIVRGEKFRLVAFFPSSIESSLIPILTTHRSELEKLAVGQFDRLRGHLDVLEQATRSRAPELKQQKRNWFGRQAGEFGGALLGEFIPRFFRNITGG